MTRRPYVAGNWKMNLLASDAVRLASDIVRKTGRHRSVDIGIVPSFPYSVSYTHLTLPTKA